LSEFKKKKAVWSVEYKSGSVVGGFVSLKALLDFLDVTHLTSAVNGISRDEWRGASALSGNGSLIADPYDLLEDF
jgi:hypothetical protein